MSTINCNSEFCHGLMRDASGEFYTLGQILNVCQREGKLLPEDSLLPLAKSVIGGLASLHRNGQIYGSLTPDDIVLLNLEGFFLMEPTWMTEIGSDQNYYDTNGLYITPETLACNTWTIASDVFSAGIVLGQCLLGRHPFQYDVRESSEQIQEHIRDHGPSVPDMLPGQLLDRGLFALVFAMLINDPVLRPRAEDLLSAFTERKQQAPFLLPEVVSVSVNEADSSHDEKS